MGGARGDPESKGVLPCCAEARTGYIKGDLRSPRRWSTHENVGCGMRVGMVYRFAEVF